MQRPHKEKSRKKELEDEQRNSEPRIFKVMTETLVALFSDHFTDISI
jgi:hypothetical protein